MKFPVFYNDPAEARHFPAGVAVGGPCAGAMLHSYHERYQNVIVMRSLPTFDARVAPTEIAKEELAADKALYFADTMQIAPGTFMAYWRYSGMSQHDAAQALFEKYVEFYTAEAARFA